MHISEKPEKQLLHVADPQAPCLKHHHQKLGAELCAPVQPVCLPVCRLVTNRDVATSSTFPLLNFAFHLGLCLAASCSVCAVSSMQRLLHSENAACWALITAWRWFPHLDCKDFAGQSVD